MSKNLSVLYAGKVAAVALLSLVAMSLISLPAASAAQTTTIRWKGSSADAYLGSQSNGTYTDVYVFATDSASMQKGSSFDQSVAYVNIYQYKQGNQVCEVFNGQENCWYEYVPLLSFSGYAPLSDTKAFQANRVNRAALQTTMTGFDWVSNSTKTITIDASWTGVGTTSSGNSMYNYRSGDYIFHGQYNGLYRQANVTVSIGGDIAINMDSSSAASSSAFLSDAKSGTVDITK